MRRWSGPNGVTFAFVQDTSPAALRRYYQLLARMSPADRIRIVASLSEAVRQLTMAGIKAAHPEASDATLRYLFVERTYGRESAQRRFGKSRP